MLAVILANPYARRGSATDAVEIVSARLAALGTMRVVTLTPASVDEAERELSALIDDAALVVAVGGDGTINVAINVVAGTGVPLAIIAVGSGNDFAHACGLLSPDLRAAADIAIGGHTRKVDVVAVTRPDGSVRRYASVLASGFDSLVADRANRLRWPRGQQRYNLAIAIEFFLLRRMRYRLSWRTPDGRDGAADDDFLMVTVANTARYGGGITISPESDAGDGVVELVMVKPAGRLRLLMLLWRVVRGRHLTDALCEVVPITNAVIDSDDTSAYADGDALTGFPARIVVEPGALTLVVAG